jgi:hypothetical protein
MHPSSDEVGQICMIEVGSDYRVRGFGAGVNPIELGLINEAHGIFIYSSAGG